MPRGDHRCQHAPRKTATPNADACQDCGTAMNRRMCVTCGHVGCCESQKGHAQAHAHKTGHPLITAMPVTRLSFTWCYRCEDYVYGPVDHPAAPEVAKAS